MLIFEYLSPLCCESGRLCLQRHRIFSTHSGRLGAMKEVIHAQGL